MIKKITVLVSLSLLLASCGAAISTLLEVNTGEAKRLAKKVIQTTSADLELESLKISTGFLTYLESEEGKAYYEAVRTEYGALKSLKLKGVQGSTSDTMNYRFTAKFADKSIDKEVRVQAYKDKDIVSVHVGDWSKSLKP